ncbi:hypothetical protein B7463_g8878, partial [Scytalidium lignicola]
MTAAINNAGTATVTMKRKSGKLALRQTFNIRLTVAVILIAVSQLNFGFEITAFSLAQAMDAFDRQFGTYKPATKAYVLEPYWLSLFNSLNFISFGIGIILGSWVSKRFGRRMCMFSMSIWALVAATIVVTSRNRDQIMAGRILNYVYIGMELAVVPIYQSEIVPAQTRGFIVGTYQVALVGGALIISGICRGTSTIEGNASWRIPLGLFYVVPSLVAASIWFVPESPRWLAMKGRNDEALVALKKFREGKFSEEQIDYEFEIIKISAAHHHREKGTFFEQFRGTNLRRTIIVIAVNFFLQASGQIFTTVYGTVYIKSLGTVNPFNITLAISLINFTVGILAMILMEKLGRRPLLLIGGVIQTISLLVMGGLGTTKPTTYATDWGVVGMMMFFSVGFSLGWAPIVHSLSAEIPSTPLRDMTYRTGGIVNIVTQFVVSFSLPYMVYAPYANLGSKVGFIYGAFAILSVIFTFFYVPEVRGRSLEEIDELFTSGIPIHQFSDAKLTVEIALEEGVKENVLHVEVQEHVNV